MQDSDEMPENNLSKTSKAQQPGIVILALESGSDASSAALRLPSGQIIQALTQARHGHAERLAEQVMQVIDKAQLQFSDVTHIAAGCGPGSFTGIRVCLAAATGLVLAGDAVPAGINMLEALLYNASMTDSQQLNLAVLDSRRQSVYARLSSESGDLDLDKEQFRTLLLAKPEVKIIGLLPEGWAEDLPSNATYQLILPSAELVAGYAAYLLEKGKPLAPLQAAYLAPPKLGPAKKPARKTA